MVTASNDNTVKIWDPSNNNWTLITTYSGHWGNVYGLEYLNTDTMISGSDDETIQMWSISLNITIRTGYVGSTVNCLKLLSNGYYLAGGLSNYKINIFNANTANLIAKLTGHTGQVNDLELIGFYLVYCFLYGTAKLDMTVFMDKTLLVFIPLKLINYMRSPLFCNNIGEFQNKKN